MTRARTAERIVAGISAGLSLLVLGLLPGCGAGEKPAARLTVDASQIRLGHGEMSPILLRWELLRELQEVEGELTVFVHLLDPEGELVRTFDRPFAQAWNVNHVVEDEIHVYHSALAPALAAGEYLLTVGLVDEKGTRWSLETTGEEVRQREYGVARVRVPERLDVVPGMRFSETWSPPTKGLDLQVLVARWLEGTGSIIVAPSDSPSTLWLTIWIPDSGESRRCVLQEGASGPAVRVRSTCSEMEACLGGSGRHELGVPLPATVEDCEIVLEPNFYVVDVNLFDRVSVALEQTGWMPGGSGDRGSSGEEE